MSSYILYIFICICIYIEREIGSDRDGGLSLCTAKFASVSNI